MCPFTCGAPCCALLLACLGWKHTQAALERFVCHEGLAQSMLCKPSFKVLCGLLGEVGAAVPGLWPNIPIDILLTRPKHDRVCLSRTGAFPS